MINSLHVNNNSLKDRPIFNSSKTLAWSYQWSQLLVFITCQRVYGSGLTVPSLINEKVGTIPWIAPTVTPVACVQGGGAAFRVKVSSVLVATRDLLVFLHCPAQRSRFSWSRFRPLQFSLSLVIYDMVMIFTTFNLKCTIRHLL